MLIKCTHVDALTGIPVTQQPAAHGPALPDLPGLTLEFWDESTWPTPAPTFYGHCDDSADPETPGVLAVLDEAEFAAARAAEFSARFVRAKAEASLAANAACDAAISTLAASYPEREVQSWPQQINEAEAMLADPAASTPLLDALAQHRGIDRLQLAARVRDKAVLFAAASGAIIGARQRIEDLLDNAQTLADVQSVPTLHELLA